MWKLDENGKIVVDDKGHPIWIDTDGKEKSFDIKDNGDLIANLRNENIERRQTNSSLETKLKAYEGIDPQKARDALKLMEEGGNEDIAGVQKRYDDLLKTQEQELTAKYEKAEESLRQALKVNAFATSEFIREHTTGDIGYLEYLFGKHFKVQDDGTVVCTHDLNNPDQLLYSKTKPTQLASFDEALSMLLNESSKRDHLLKAVNNQGGGVDNKGNYVGKKWSDFSEKELAHIAENQPELFDELAKTREN